MYKVTIRHLYLQPHTEKMVPNGYLSFEDEQFIESSVAKLNALRKSGQFCDVKLQVLFFLCTILEEAVACWSA